MYEFEAGVRSDEIGRRVQTGMVGPLVGDAQWHFGDLAVFHMAEAVCVLLTWIAFIGGEEFAQVELLPRLQFADRIFRQYHHAE